MNLTDHLRSMIKLGASDLFFSAGAPVSAKVQGEVEPVESDILPEGGVWDIVQAHLDDEQRTKFQETMELNFALSLESGDRFRINLYRQRGDVSMVIRHVPFEVPTLEKLRLPDTLADIVMQPRGLVLVVGATSSGKSSALAAMIRHRSEKKSGHILTIEEPIEFQHHHAKSIVEQREVGTDTLSYAAALKNAMREAPDVIMIGEIRDRETMESAIAYAETGHLCLSTLHANNANQALERIVNFFPESSHAQLLLDLSINLNAVISLRLLRAIGGGRLPAYEILLRSAYISELIKKRDVGSIKEAMARSMVEGMVTFDQTIFRLWQEGKVSADEALDNADSRSNLQRLIKLDGGEADDGNSGLSVNLD